MILSKKKTSKTSKTTGFTRCVSPPRRRGVFGGDSHQVPVAYTWPNEKSSNDLPVSALPLRNDRCDQGLAGWKIGGQMLDDRGKCWVFLAVDFCSMVFSRFLENKDGVLKFRMWRWIWSLTERMCILRMVENSYGMPKKKIMFQTFLAIRFVSRKTVTFFGGLVI